MTHSPGQVGAPRAEAQRRREPAGVTLRHVAAAAGVSVATASRAFSRPEKFDPSTRARILRLADELRYVPHRAAQALITGRTMSLGLVVPDLTNPFFPGVIKGAQARARERGLSLLIADTDEDPGAELALVGQLAQRTDAVVLCSSRMPDDDLDRAARLCPVVLVNREHPGVPAVTFDSDAGVREAAVHLRALGHRRVGYVGGPAHSFSDAARAAGLHAEFPAHGLEVVLLGNHDPSFEGGRRAADVVLSSDVTAVMVHNDVMALGLVGRLLDYGLDIPRELSVIGWDDIEFAGMFTPGLTTVRMPREDAGRAAVGYLEAALGGRTSEPPRLETHLVFRQTTARAHERRPG